jgi:hypothetical protein
MASAVVKVALLTRAGAAREAHHRGSVVVLAAVSLGAREWRIVWYPRSGLERGWE